jgi:ribosome-binding protein aMBF1 (putative translation factor)
MRKHTQIYLQGMGLKKCDFIPCEVCGRQAVDIHHIKARGMGGSDDKDVIENLMAVCRSCHLEYGDKKQWVDFLTDKHKEKLNDHRC